MLCVLAGVLAVVCVQGDGGAGAAGDHARTWADGTPVVRTDGDVPELPFAAYEFDGADKDAYLKWESAVGLLAQRCMVRHGFADFPRDPQPYTMAATYTVTGVAMSAGPVGSHDLENARRWGYGWDPAKAVGPRRHTGRMMTSEESEVYHGDQEAGDNGCSGEAERRLRRGVHDIERVWTYVTEREDAVDKRAARDPRLRRAYRVWADCVAGKGFTRYADPMAAADDKAWRRGQDGNTRRTRREIGTAVADVECKRAHNTAGVWWSVTARLQRRELAAHRAEFDAVRADRDRVLRNVRAVLGTEGS
ncbi:hypothetical protein [Streptomyces sp. NPDC046939]|uniref:hypothetical protein n=1 Tax=Streptomyces sp. NPDC046939 TaxID=3155376 RepID=UPI0033D67513